MCDYCGVMWRRSQMRKDRAGLLACPDDVKGRDTVTLAEGNAAAAKAHQDNQHRASGGRVVGTNVSAAGVVDESVYVNRTTIEDVEG